MKAPVLNSERLELRPLDMSFCTHQYVAWLNDEDVYRYLETKGNYSIDKLREYLSDVEQKQILFWGITIKASGKHIGNIKIDPVNPIHGLCEYGIMLGEKSEWNRGYAKEASKIVIDYCFDELNLRKMTLGVLENNIAAVKLYISLGFTIEGLYKDHEIHDGKYFTGLRMALFNSNYNIKQ